MPPPNPSLHNFEPRLARWLLICADRAHSNKFKMSHEFLADMLGGTLATLSTAAGILKEKGPDRIQRGQIHILDVQRLTKASCECYRIIENPLDNYAELDSAITA